jgi:predicted dehydrogenase
VGDREVTGEVLPGTAEEPGLYMDSVHNLMKVVAGTPLLRPAWFFDTDVQGEALADVGTHLVDLVPFLLFPDQAVDLGQVRLVAAKRWPTVLQRDQLLRVLGEATVPAPLAGRLEGDRFDYFCNTRVDYTLNGINVRLDVRWNYEAPPGGGDTHFAVVRGRRARIEVRQGPEQRYRTEVYVVPSRAGDKPAVLAAVKRKLASLAPRYPGLAVEDAGAELRVVVPDAFRTGHEAHFAEVTRRFLEYLKDPAQVPGFETANMLAKYSVTTRGTELSRQGGRP